MMRCSIRPAGRILSSSNSRIPERPRPFRISCQRSTPSMELPSQYLTIRKSPCTSASWRTRSSTSTFSKILPQMRRKITRGGSKTRRTAVRTVQARKKSPRPSNSTRITACTCSTHWSKVEWTTLPISLTSAVTLTIRRARTWTSMRRVEPSTCAMLSLLTCNLISSRSQWSRTAERASARTQISQISPLRVRRTILRRVTRCCSHRRVCMRYSKSVIRTASSTSSARSPSSSPVLEWPRIRGNSRTTAPAIWCSSMQHRLRQTCTKWFNSSTDMTARWSLMARRRMCAWVPSRVRMSRVPSSTTLSSETCLICSSWGTWAGPTHQAAQTGRTSATATARCSNKQLRAATRTWVARFPQPTHHRIVARVPVTISRWPRPATWSTKSSNSYSNNTTTMRMSRVTTTHVPTAEFECRVSERASEWH